MLTVLQQELVDGGVVIVDKVGRVACEHEERQTELVAHHGVLVARGALGVIIRGLRTKRDDPVCGWKMIQVQRKEIQRNSQDSSGTCVKTP